MKSRFLVPSLVLAGFCLLAIGFAWDRIVPSSAYWKADQAKEYAEAQLDMHTKSHQHGANAEQEMAAARERFAKISQQLERARSSRTRFGTLFLTAGILLCLAGVGLHFAQKRSE
jgi:hypothetical protein